MSRCSIALKPNELREWSPASSVAGKPPRYPLFVMKAAQEHCPHLRVQLLFGYGDRFFQLNVVR